MNEYQKPYTFRVNTYAKSSEVNTNFDSVKDYINELRTYIENVQIGSAPYNKADINGSSDNIFKVKNGVESSDAVNLGQLQDVQADINSVAGDVAELQNAGFLVAPSYSGGQNIVADSTITRSGILVIKAEGFGTPSIVIDGTTFTLAFNQLFSLPVKNGTTVGDKTNIAFSVLYS